GGVAGGLVSQDPDDDLRKARSAGRRSPARAVGHPGVLPRLQRRQWRPRAGIGCVRGVAMNMAPDIEALRRRQTPLEMSPDEFRAIGYRLVDQIADRLATLGDRVVTPDESPADVRRVLGADQTLPAAGTDAGRLVSDAAGLL